MKYIYAIIIPLHNEEECIGQTLEELIPRLPQGAVVSAGLNGCSDNTATICREHGVLVGETEATGYGKGCYAAIEALKASQIQPDAYLFYAGDGANQPDDLLRLIDIYEEEGSPFVMGLRDFELGNWCSEFGRALPNLLLGTLCRVLGGQFFHDLGPLRLISKDLFEQMDLRELEWGWTIEAQLRAAHMDVAIRSTPVEERPRISGTQKISGVSPFRSLKVGMAIGAAAIRTVLRKRG